MSCSHDDWVIHKLDFDHIEIKVCRSCHHFIYARELGVWGGADLSRDWLIANGYGKYLGAKEVA